MSNVVSIGRSRKRLALAAWCAYAAILLDEVPQTRRPGQRAIVDDRREEDLAVVRDAFNRICQLGDDALAELAAEYEQRLRARTRPTSRYFSSADEIVGKVG